MNQKLAQEQTSTIILEHQCEECAAYKKALKKLVSLYDNRPASENCACPVCTAKKLLSKD